MKPDKNDFAKKWIDSWNSHDLDKILDHYADDFSITSPMIKVALGIDTGALKGKDKIRQYWQAALEKVPHLHFEFIDVTESIDSIAIYYKSVFDKKAVEVFFFNDSDKVSKVIAHYN
ncbi:MAG: nuclear transport factor 2 family protein [Deltaproteobacteria bacterium]|nr:nuclear transport factor 2 family protein [Deltaproteobacteria bacterium]